MASAVTGIIVFLILAVIAGLIFYYGAVYGTQYFFGIINKDETTGDSTKFIYKALVILFWSLPFASLGVSVFLGAIGGGAAAGTSSSK